MSNRKLISFLTGLLILMSIREANAQDFPEKPVPPRLVNDYSGMLTGGEADRLERKLVAFDDSTSTQIAIVIINDLKGYDIGDYAQRLAEKWGIGQKGLDNGILVLVKQRTQTSGGQVFITPGYGLEGVIPDILCKEIVENEVLPSFRQERYYEGLDKSTDVLMSLVRGLFPPDKYKKTNVTKSVGPIIFIIIILIVIMFIRGSSGGRNNRNIGSKGLPLWLLLSMMNSGRGSHRGTWGGFSGGGGFKGGGGGGFGGFGGGGFGGGGAGGSW